MKNEQSRCGRLPKSLLTGTLLAAPAAVAAAGLGELVVLSALGEPLRAEIDLIAGAREEIGSMTARLVPNGPARGAGIELHSGAARARVLIARRANGTHYVRIESAVPINEPAIGFRVELSWDTGSFFRDYTAFVDPPTYAFRGSNTRASVAPPAMPAAAAGDPGGSRDERSPSAIALARTQVAESNAPRAEQPPSAGPRRIADARSGPARSEYGPVRPGETLARIAESVRPTDVSLEQAIVALFRENPEAFIRRNMNLLRVGAVLSVPQRDGFQATPRADALDVLRTHSERLRDGHQPVASGVGTPARTGTQDADSLAPDGGTAARYVTPAPAVRAEAERAPTLDEMLAAKDREITATNERIAKLEQTIEHLRAELKAVDTAAEKLREQIFAGAQSGESAATGRQGTAPASAASAGPAPGMLAAVVRPPESNVPKTESFPLAVAMSGAASLLALFGVWWWRRRRHADAAAHSIADVSSIFGTPPALPDEPSSAESQAPNAMSRARSSLADDYEVVEVHASAPSVAPVARAAPVGAESAKAPRGASDKIRYLRRNDAPADAHAERVAGVDLDFSSPGKDAVAAPKAEERTIDLAKVGRAPSTTNGAAASADAGESTWRNVSTVSAANDAGASESVAIDFDLGAISPAGAVSEGSAAAQGGDVIVLDARPTDSVDGDLGVDLILDEFPAPESTVTVAERRKLAAGDVKKPG